MCCMEGDDGAMRECVCKLSAPAARSLRCRSVFTSRGLDTHWTGALRPIKSPRQNLNPCQYCLLRTDRHITFTFTTYYDPHTHMTRTTEITHARTGVERDTKLLPRPVPLAPPPPQCPARAAQSLLLLPLLPIPTWSMEERVYAIIPFSDRTRTRTHNL
jgi:hypothetical protein